MNNISFKGFYHVDPINNKKANMQLVSQMVKTIPNTDSIGYTDCNSKTFFVPKQEEPQFHRLVEALKAKSLVNIEPVNAQLPSIDTLLETKIRDFNPSDEYTYVSISTEEFTKFLDMCHQKPKEKDSKFNLFYIALYNSKIDVPELEITDWSEFAKSPVCDSKEMKKFPYRLRMENNSADTVFSFLKLGYKEFPVKVRKETMEEIEKLSEMTGCNLISRKIDVLPIGA